MGWQEKKAPAFYPCLSLPVSPLTPSLSDSFSPCPIRLSHTVLFSLSFTFHLSVQTIHHAVANASVIFV